MTVLERALRDFKFELPSTSIRRLVADADTIIAPKLALEKVLAESRNEQVAVHRRDLDDFCERFTREHQLGISFTPAAVDRLLALGSETGKTMRSLCEQRFKDLHFGLKLVSQASGQSVFQIDAEMIDNADKVISGMIVQTYRK
jgi:hypothetical protein